MAKTETTKDNEIEKSNDSHGNVMINILGIIITAAIAVICVLLAALINQMSKRIDDLRATMNTTFQTFEKAYRAEFKIFLGEKPCFRTLFLRFCFKV